MKRIILSVLLLGLLLVGAFGTAESHDEAPVLSRILEKGELRVATSGNQPPFSMTTKTGELIGYEVDLAKLLADAMGVELKLLRVPFPKLLETLEAGDVDMVMSGVTMTAHRNVRVAFEGPYIVSGKSILTPSSSLLAAFDLASEIDQKELIFVALKDSTSERFVKKRLPESGLVTTRNYDDAVKLLLEGKADAMVADIPICAITMLRYPDANLGMLSRPLTIEPIGLALPAGDSLLLNMVENYLDALESVGVLDTLEQRWFEDGTWVVDVPWK